MMVCSYDIAISNLVNADLVVLNHKAEQFIGQQYA